MKLICKCGATNRLPSVPNARIRCGKCKYEFKPTDLVKAVQESPKDFELAVQDDSDLFDEAGECEFMSDPEDKNFCLSCGLHKRDHKGD